jgi:hypothetical protein
MARVPSGLFHLLRALLGRRHSGPPDAPLLQRGRRSGGHRTSEAPRPRHLRHAGDQHRVDHARHLCVCRPGPASLPSNPRLYDDNCLQWVMQRVGLPSASVGQGMQRRGPGLSNTSAAPLDADGRLDLTRFTFQRTNVSTTVAVFTASVCHHNAAIVGALSVIFVVPGWHWWWQSTQARYNREPSTPHNLA